MPNTPDSHPVKVHGRVADGFEPVQEAFAENFSGDEVGASFAAFRNGRTLVDIWAGYADRSETRPWERDTLGNVWSTTKGMTATCCAMLVDRGLLDYDATVASYWPEFGGRGREKVTLAMLLSHQAGMSGVREPLSSWLDFLDGERINRLLFEQEPLFEPGSASGYHAISYGTLVGELVRRVTGESLGNFLRREVCEPLGADFYIGLPESEDHRTAEMIGHPVGDTPMTSANEVQRAALANPPPDPEVPNQRAWRAGEIPSANGQASASGIARIYDALANGGEVDGVRLLSAATLDRARSCQIDEVDLVLPVQMFWGCGFILNNMKVIYGPNSEAFGHTGYGGAFGYADPVTGIGVGYVMNQMAASLLGDPRGIRLVRALHGCL